MGEIGVMIAILACAIGIIRLANRWTKHPNR